MAAASDPMVIAFNLMVGVFHICVSWMTASSACLSGGGTLVTVLAHRWNGHGRMIWVNDFSAVLT